MRYSAAYGPSRQPCPRRSKAKFIPDIGRWLHTCCMARSIGAPPPDAVQKVQDYVTETIGDAPKSWPGGWPEEIEAALIDAVFSVRARYGNRVKKTGVFGAVMRWRQQRVEAANDLRVLMRTEPVHLRAVTNNGRLAGRYKAEVVIEAATALANAGVVTADDFRDKQPAARSAYLSVKGCGPVTWAYLRMLMNVDDVKTDTWVIRFVNDVVPGVGASEAGALLKEVATRMDVDERRLDHAVWAYRRTRR